MSEPTTTDASSGETGAAGQQPEAAAAAPTSVSETQMADVQRSFLRLTFWQTLLSLAGVFTGAVALYAALNESQAVREQTAASVWPYVQLMIHDTDDGEDARFALSFENVGVGPALMGGMKLTFDGVAVPTWDVATAGLLGEPAQVGVDFGRNSVSRRVIAPGESVVAFQTDDRRLVLQMQRAVYEGAVDLSYCYCSIFEACWQSRSWRPTGEAHIEAVDSCPDHGDAAFRD